MASLIMSQISRGNCLMFQLLKKQDCQHRITTRLGPTFQLSTGAVSGSNNINKRRDNQQMHKSNTASSGNSHALSRTKAAEASHLILVKEVQERWHLLDHHHKLLTLQRVGSFFSVANRCSDQQFQMVIRSCIQHIDTSLYSVYSSPDIRKETSQDEITFQQLKHLILSRTAALLEKKSIYQLSLTEMEHLLHLLEEESSLETPTVSEASRIQLLEIARLPLLPNTPTPRHALFALSSLGKKWPALNSALQYHVLEHVKSQLEEYMVYDKGIYRQFPATVVTSILTFVQQLSAVECHFHMDLLIDGQNIGVDSINMIAKALHKKDMVVNKNASSTGHPEKMSVGHTQVDLLHNSSLQITAILFNSLAKMACSYKLLPVDTQFNLLLILRFGMLNYLQLKNSGATLHDFSLSSLLSSILTNEIELTYEHLSLLLECIRWGLCSPDIGECLATNRSSLLKLLAHGLRQASWRSGFNFSSVLWNSSDLKDLWDKVTLLIPSDDSLSLSIVDEINQAIIESNIIGE